MSSPQLSPFRSRRSPAGIIIFVVAVCMLAAAGGALVLWQGKKSGTSQPPKEPPMQSVTLDGRTVELFMEHPPLVQGEAVKFNVHLTVLADGMPVRSGKLTVIAKSPSGKKTTAVQNTPKSPGIYGPVVTFAEPGTNELILVLESEQARETIQLPVKVFRT